MGMNLLGVIFLMVAIGVILFLFFRLCAKDENDSKSSQPFEEKPTNQPNKSIRIPSRIPYSNEYYSIASAAMNLAKATLDFVISQKNMKNAKFLFCTDVSSADAVIFSCFFLRALCISSTNNRTAAMQFSDAYVSYIIDMTQNVFLDEDVAQKMFDNRTRFYDKIIMENGGLKNGTPKVLNEFGFIIQTDMIQQKYVPFSSSLPLPLIDFFDAMQCQEEIYNFFRLLVPETEKEVNQAILSIQ